MGRATEAISALNSEFPLDKEHYYHLDVENKQTRQVIIKARRAKKSKQLNLF